MNDQSHAFKQHNIFIVPSFTSLLQKIKTMLKIEIVPYFRASFLEKTDWLFFSTSYVVQYILLPLATRATRVLYRRFNRSQPANKHRLSSQPSQPDLHHASRPNLARQNKRIAQPNKNQRIAEAPLRPPQPFKYKGRSNSNSAIESQI